MINNAVEYYIHHICALPPPRVRVVPADPEKLERLAVARLQHTVNELQTQVDQDRTLVPPTRNIFHCICDDSALTASIGDLKRFIADKTITMVVPFTCKPPSSPSTSATLTHPLAALDSLDRLKKGAEETNVHARESIRYFDRMLQAAPGRKPITGVCIQGPSEKYSSWGDVVTAAAAGVEEPDQEPPARIKELLNCAVFALRNTPARGGDKVLLVTNDDVVREWAEAYGVPTVGSAEMIRLVKVEDVQYAERRRQYEYALNPRSPGGRGSARGARGGRGGGGGGGGRRNSWKEEECAPRVAMNPNGFGRGARGPREFAPLDYTVRGPTRGVARGRGKLWEP